jgi:putative redox protein
MKITVTRIDKDFHMEAVNDTDNKVYMDGSPAIGGKNQGARPMQLLLMGLGGCSCIDIISILRKQRIDPTSLSADVEGERDPEKVPSLFERIHITFNVGGVTEKDFSKVAKAAELSMQKYCSVAKMLESKAVIEYKIVYE